MSENGPQLGRPQSTGQRSAPAGPQSKEAAEEKKIRNDAARRDATTTGPSFSHFRATSDGGSFAFSAFISVNGPMIATVLNRSSACR
jgi:hypothetical protein